MGPGSPSGTGGPGSLGGSGLGSAGGFGGGTGQGGAGGMPKSLLDAKYPGASKKKNKKYGATANNMAQLIGGTILGGVLGPVAGSLVKGAINTAVGIDPMNPFDDYQGEVPSTGAGFAEGKDTDKKQIGLTAATKKRKSKPTSPLGSIGTILSGAGGTLVAGGL
jgi:hypothetical protein